MVSALGTRLGFYIPFKNGRCSPPRGFPVYDNFPYQKKTNRRAPMRESKVLNSFFLIVGILTLDFVIFDLKIGFLIQNCVC